MKTSFLFLFFDRWWRALKAFPMCLIKKLFTVPAQSYFFKKKLNVFVSLLKYSKFRMLFVRHMSDLSHMVQLARNGILYHTVLLKVSRWFLFFSRCTRYCCYITLASICPGEFPCSSSSSSSA